MKETGISDTKPQVLDYSCELIFQSLSRKIQNEFSNNKQFSKFEQNKCNCPWSKEYGNVHPFLP
jgi:hypothetical protein